MGFEATISRRTDPLTYGLDGESTTHFKKAAEGLPPVFAERLEAGGDDEAVHDTITEIVTTRLSNLVSVPKLKIAEGGSLERYGIDNMIVAAFRTQSSWHSRLTFRSCICWGMRQGRAPCVKWLKGTWLTRTVHDRLLECNEYDLCPAKTCLAGASPDPLAS